MPVLCIDAAIPTDQLIADTMGRLDGTTSTTVSPNFVLAESLLRVWSRHAGKIADVRSSRKKLERARAYLNSPGCNEALGRTHLELRKRAHASLLDDLRRVRHEAWELAQLVDRLPADPPSPRPWSGDNALVDLARSPA